MLGRGAVGAELQIQKNCVKSVHFCSFGDDFCHSAPHTLSTPKKTILDTPMISTTTQTEGD